MSTSLTSDLSDSLNEFQDLDNFRVLFLSL